MKPYTLPWRRLFDIAPDAAYWTVVVSLLCASAIFSWDVQHRRGAWRTDRGGAAVPSGSEVELVRVIDGDEVSVARAGETFIVRLLGIKSFDAKTQDPGIGGFGVACAHALEARLSAAGPLRLVYEEAKRDANGQLLAYLENEDGDIGRALLAEGLTLAYTKYPFSREATYRADEASARAERRGLWGHPRAAQRAEALQAAWAAEAGP